MELRKLGKQDPDVTRISLGAMGMSGMYGEADRAASIATLHAAIERGVTLIDTGDFYGMGHNELLIAEALRGVPRDRYQLSVKFGALRGPDGNWLGYDASPRAAKTMLAYSLQRLGTDYIDIYRPSRLDPDVPIAETVGAIGEMVDKGYVRHIGLSEMGAETLARAAAERPISDLQIEYSLMSRGIEEAILPKARELGIGVTAYGVLARGLLSGGWRADRSLAGDFRGVSPRFQGEQLAHNLALADALAAVAAELGATPAQSAIAWVLAQGEDIVALVGARTPDRLAESLNADRLALTPDQLGRIEAAIPRGSAAGDRYPAQQMAFLDSER